MLPHAQISEPLGQAVHSGDLCLLAVVPAFNERANLSRVVADLSRVMPLRNILIVNDGSTDGTAELLPSLGVRWLTLSQRLGVGGAVRAGIRYAERAGYTYVVRIDGDAQHRACDIARLLAPVASGRADVALGSRFLRRRSDSPRVRRLTPGAARRLPEHGDQATSNGSDVWVLVVWTEGASTVGWPPPCRVRRARAAPVPGSKQPARDRSADPHAAANRRAHVADSRTDRPRVRADGARIRRGSVQADGRRSGA